MTQAVGPDIEAAQIQCLAGKDLPGEIDFKRVWSLDLNQTVLRQNRLRGIKVTSCVMP